MSDSTAKDPEATPGSATPRPKRRVGSWVVIVAFLASGITHLVNPAVFYPLLPEWTPLPGVVVVASGIAEITAAVGLLLRMRFAPAFTVLVLLAIWPANWWFAIDQTLQGTWPVAVAAWLRLPLQIPLIWWAWTSPRRGSRS